MSAPTFKPFSNQQQQQQLPDQVSVELPNYWDNVEQVATFKLPCLFYWKRRTVVLNCFAQLLLLILFPIKVDGLIFQECAEKAQAEKVRRLSKGIKTLIFSLWAAYFILGGLVACARSFKLAYIFLVASIPVLSYQIFWHPHCTEVNLYSVGLNLYILFVVVLPTIDFVRIEKMTGGRPWSVVYD